MAQDAEKLRPEEALNSLAADDNVDHAQVLDKLSQTESNPLEEKDIAEVLDATAFKPKHGKADALEAMASGQWQEEEPSPTADEAPSSDTGTATVLPDGLAPITGSSLNSSQARINRARMAQKSSNDSLKKFFVPLLLVVGALLWVMGGIVGYMVATEKIHSSGVKTLMIVSAFPLGAILMAGAWLFHRETAGK
jgi:hypothetical protein